MKAAKELPQLDETPEKSLSYLERKLAQQMGKTIVERRLIEPGDRVMVAISGGKDSYTLLHLLKRFQRAAPIELELLAVHLDQRQPGFAGDQVRRYLDQSGVPYEIVSRDTYSVVIEKTRPGQATCFMCSRLRRGILYTEAKRLGCTKIALGHHRDDAIETLLLNLMFSGQLKSMPAKLVADDGVNQVIRPLIEIPEERIARFAARMEWPIAPCVVCDSQKDLRRRDVKGLLTQLEQRIPGVRGSIFAAMANLKPAFLFDERFADTPGTSGERPDVAAACGANQRSGDWLDEGHE
ncbi:MAG: tRNA 2-thiocytidine(32) synthetase TtcA [Myxococcales bacterium]|nr:tRNA 2-thiocytidine(32) synthetase TtcA [Myxococcales bacterium]